MHNVGAFNITAPQQGWYHLYIGAGPERSGSVLDWVSARAGTIGAVHAIGGTAALSDDTVDAVIGRIG